MSLLLVLVNRIKMKMVEKELLRLLLMLNEMKNLAGMEWKR
jgi:hypothetical protein